jgi:hypothetical protein
MMMRITMMMMVRRREIILTVEVVGDNGNLGVPNRHTSDAEIGRAKEHESTGTLQKFQQRVESFWRRWATHHSSEEKSAED